ncbi:MAG: UDP-3-O-(3-hydroxymyristoyl)glucosamine N-acyltransferase [Curvibacter sp.]|jgi:UDP-3-O-[3-hydroxymyristoyl] glucosamine N-acyltransferase|nr:UDP-3-O-(3-hydroxymyristoyl)glucosamine N-acyltransferase [Curvibacter sp.]
MYSLQSILSNIGCDYQVRGSRDNFATNFCSLFEARSDSVCWMRARGGEALEIIKATPSSILICGEIDVPDRFLQKKTLILVENPHVAYLRLLRNMFSHQYRVEPGIHASAVVSPNAAIGANVSIGPFVTVGACTIGDNCVIKSHAVIHDRALIGSNVLISEHCNIGGEGFGYIKNEQNELENMLHVGSVVLEDDVAIFPYTNIDRSTLGQTRVGRGTKIDHYCHIGHNSKIGSNSIITPNVTLLGGARIGNECMVGCGSALRDGVVVGDRVTIGMASVVTKDIPDNETWVGSPARPIDDFKLLQMRLSELILGNG